MESEPQESISTYQLRVIVDQIEYRLIGYCQYLLTLNRKNDPALYRNMDIIFRGILFEICSFFKEFNIKLYVSTVALLRWIKIMISSFMK